MSDATEAKGAMEMILERVRDYVLSGDEVSVERVVSNAVTLSRSFAAQNARLMAENADLWAFVRAHDNESDAWWGPGDDWHDKWEQCSDAMREARNALRKYQSDTSDSEAIRRAEPRTLGTDNPTSENLKG